MKGEVLVQIIQWVFVGSLVFFFIYLFMWLKRQEDLKRFELQPKLESGEAPLADLIKKEVDLEINFEVFDNFFSRLQEAQKEARKLSPFGFFPHPHTRNLPKSPKPRVFYSPGKSFQEYLKFIAYDYQNCRNEYFLVGVFKGDSPQWTYEIKGRSAWVTFDWDKILEEIRNEVTLVDGLAIFHNHPTRGKYSPPSLKETDEDLNTTFYAYYTVKKFGLKFLGAYILSQGLYSEYFKKYMALCSMVVATYLKYHLRNIFNKAYPVFSRINSALESNSISEEELEEFSAGLQFIIKYIEELGNIKPIDGVEINSTQTDVGEGPKISGNYPKVILSLTDLFLSNLNFLLGEIENLKGKEKTEIKDLIRLIKPFNRKVFEWAKELKEICDLLECEFFSADFLTPGEKIPESRFVVFRFGTESPKSSPISSLEKNN